MARLPCTPGAGSVPGDWLDVLVEAWLNPVCRNPVWEGDESWRRVVPWTLVVHQMVFSAGVIRDLELVAARWGAESQEARAVLRRLHDGTLPGSYCVKCGLTALEIIRGAQIVGERGWWLRIPCVRNRGLVEFRAGLNIRLPAALVASGEVDEDALTGLAVSQFDAEAGVLWDMQHTAACAAIWARHLASEEAAALQTFTAKTV